MKRKSKVKKLDIRKTPEWNLTYGKLTGIETGIAKAAEVVMQRAIMYFRTHNDGQAREIRHISWELGEEIKKAQQFTQGFVERTTKENR